MKIFESLNLFKDDEQLVGLKNLKESKKDKENPTIFTGDYSISMFKFNLDQTINPSVGQNLYFLS